MKTPIDRLDGRLALGRCSPLVATAPAARTTEPEASAEPAEQRREASARLRRGRRPRPRPARSALTDAFGRTVELDQPAERVAVLEWQQIEDVLTLCVTPVAVADVEGYAHLGHRRGPARRRRRTSACAASRTSTRSSPPTPTW